MAFVSVAVFISFVIGVLIFPVCDRKCPICCLSTRGHQMRKISSLHCIRALKELVCVRSRDVIDIHILPSAIPAPLNSLVKMALACSMVIHQV